MRFLIRFLRQRDRKMPHLKREPGQDAQSGKEQQDHRQNLQEREARFGRTGSFGRRSESRHLNGDILPCAGCKSQFEESAGRVLHRDTDINGRLLIILSVRLPHNP